MTRERDREGETEVAKTQSGNNLFPIQRDYETCAISDGAQITHFDTKGKAVKVFFEPISCATNKEKEVVLIRGNSRQESPNC